jgi:hypothetical protein
MANINWSAIGTSLSGVASTLNSLGITGANAGTILGAIGLSANPNQSSELAICSSILMGMANPMLVQALTMKLVTEQGIPQDAAALAMTLLQPGTNIPQTVLEIETLIKQGG